MEIQTHVQLLELLQQEFTEIQCEVIFTQWDNDSEDEEVTQFIGQLSGVRLTDNEFMEKDLLLSFQVEEAEVVEILMELPKEEVDLAAFENSRLQIFGTEAEVVIAK